MRSGTSQRDNGGGGKVALTAAVIAEAVGGQLVGDPSTVVVAVAPLDRAGASDLAFLGVAKYVGAFATSCAGVVLVSPELAETPGSVQTRVVVDKPQEALLALLPRFHRVVPTPPGIHPTAVIGTGVALGRDVSIGPYAVVGDDVCIGPESIIGAHCVIGSGVEIGERVQLFPSVTIYSGSRLGNRVTLHAGSRIGSDGFGYVQRGGEHAKIPHVGRCLIEDDVEIGANTTIDRGSIDDTVVGAGTKIDNLVQVAHNVRIGKMCLIMAHAGIAGSAHVEDGAMLLGQVGVAGHSTIGKGARVAAQAGVFGDIPAGETWSGYPARPHKDALRAQAALFKLPSLLRRIERLLDGPTDTK
ncbi:MAG TPA: UDP-3-O-(3-hydroxymyristoyl)glucosamine N-acyltransferase [Gemmatimonadaceae bacterium]|jgi:UDP-3-O-[3-hydroxymyristoyl] glucosamine N-acyltransferase|nr:UDP-3-O-(3-hydroxymyristoyl)glucosamine N-acyltransferase [Gemmatimonadaceae bacterium]